MHITPSGEGLSNCGSDTKVMMTITRSKIKVLITDVHEGIHVELFQAKVETQTVARLVEMLNAGKGSPGEIIILRPLGS